MSFVRTTRRLSLVVGAGLVGNWIGNLSERRKFLGLELRRFSQWFLLQNAMIDFFWASENYPALASLLRSADPGNFRLSWDILGRAKSESEMAMIDINGDRIHHKIIFHLSQKVSVHPADLLSLAQSSSPFWPHLVDLVDRKFVTKEISDRIAQELLRRKSEKIFDFLYLADAFTLSPTETEICWKFFPHRRRELLDLHFSRSGRVHGNFLLQVISDPRMPVPGYACTELFSFLPALVERSEICLGLTDVRVRAYAEHLAQSLEEISEFEKFPIIITHEEFLRRTEIITDSLAPGHPLSEIFRLLKSQFSDCPKISANIAALGPARSPRKIVGPEISTPTEPSGERNRKLWNEEISRFPAGPRLLEGLNPVYWPESKFPTAVVVLVHGLQGDEKTWRFADGESEISSGNLWPGVLLPEKFPEISVFTFSFDAPLWSVEHQERYTEISVPRRIEAISDRLKVSLEAAGLDKFPCIFVCHSMGGLVVKHLLVNDRKCREISRGVVFFSTPHLGSSIADFARTNLLTPPFVAELSRKDKALLALNDRFVALKFPTLNFFETAPTEIGPGIKTVVVSRTSAEGAGGISVSAGERIDHVQCCKLPRVQAASSSDERLKRLLEFLTAVLAN